MPFDATVAAFDAVCDDARRAGSRAGYFAALYRGVTREVRDRAAAGRFADPARMDRFVDAFAARYLDAHAAWRAGRPTTAAWAAAFDAVSRWRPVVLQHLLLGMNAHINLDLGIVAAELGGDPAGLALLRRDFDEVNDVLASLVEASQAGVGRVSPWLGLADRVGGRSDETMVRFSITVARRQAWAFAQRLAALPPADRAAEIARVDAAVARLARRVLHPGAVLSTALLVVRLRETAQPAQVIDALGGPPPDLAG